MCAYKTYCVYIHRLFFAFSKTQVFADFQKKILLTILSVMKDDDVMDERGSTVIPLPEKS